MGQADIDMAIKIVIDSKCQYVAVCNATETLLVDSKIAKEFLPKVKAAFDAKNVELRGDKKTRSIIKVKPATEKDWSTEYLDYILSIKVVDGVDEAIEHINHYGSHHTDAIVTQDKATAEKFLDLVDSAGVFWNCSTRFCRWLPLWLRRGSRHKHNEDSRPRPRRPRRPPDLQMETPRLRPNCRRLRRR